MLVILDSSTLINLVNGEVLEHVLRLLDVDFLVSGMVREESSSITEAVDQAVASGKLNLIQDDAIPVAVFVEAKRVMNLGDGETECILAAQMMDCHIGCDDRLARQKAAVRFGSDVHITGSIGLLKKVCRAGLLDAEQAMYAYELMRQRGGYLPQVGADAFAIDDD